MRTHLSNGAAAARTVSLRLAWLRPVAARTGGPVAERTGAPAAARSWRQVAERSWRPVAQRTGWRSRWLEFSALVLLTVVLIECLHRSWAQPPMLAPLLAVPPALAGIGAASVRRPLAYGGISLLAAVAVALKPTEFAGWLPGVTIFTVAVITAVAAAGTSVSLRQQRRIADVTSVAEAAQRALLRPPPPRVGPLGFDVAYLAAVAEAKVGGDLYEVARTADHGIRVIMGDVRGKGLGAVELASDVLGMFRELAHDAGTLGELAVRLDAALGRGLGRHEEFVTAVLVEIDQESGRALVFNCGHPPPLLISGSPAAAGRVALVEVPAPAPPLGLLTLGDCAGAQLPVTLGPADQLLLYTDGVTEARDATRAFYPLPERVSALTGAPVRLGGKADGRVPAGNPGGKAPAGNPGGKVPGGKAPGGKVPGGKAPGGKAPGGKAPAGGPSADGGPRPGLLDLVLADLLRHVGAPLDDDAALLLIQAPAAWPAEAVTAAPARLAPTS